MTDNILDFPVPVIADPEPVDGDVFAADMGAQEAQHTENQIKAVASKLGELLEDMRVRKGWKALGFESWTAYLQSGRLQASRATLYRALKDWRLSQIETFAGLNQSQKIELDKFPESHQASVRVYVENESKRLGETLTAPFIRDHGEVFMQAVYTSHVDDEDGNPMHIAGDAISKERKARQQEHIRESLREQGGIDVIIVPERPQQTAKAIADVLSMDALDALARALVSEYGQRWERGRVG